MRVPPRPLNESAPLLAVGMRAHVLPASLERRMPSPKYESPELSASPVAARITDFAGSELPGWIAMDPMESVGCASVSGVHVTLLAVALAALFDFQMPLCAPPM